MRFAVRKAGAALGLCILRWEAQMAVTFIRSDLEFILAQIQIAERNAAGESLLDILPNVEVPWGLRTVDGSDNNLVVGQNEFGAADNVFPRLTDPVYRPAQAGTSYAQVGGTVIDSTPRTISNLIVDQTANNPAAYAIAFDPGADGILHTPDDVLKDGVHIVTSPGLDGLFGTTDDREVFQFDNVSPDAGLAAPFNPWFTFFGQFFDHGLDLVTKGGNGTIFVPLNADDPLVAGADGIFGTPDDLPPQLRFMVETRATVITLPGADGILGTADDAPIGGMATWAVVKAQARDILGINLTDKDFDNVPLLATDAYGNFIKGPNGFPQVVIRTGNGPDGIAGTADDPTTLVEGNPLAPVDLTNAVRTGHQFLIDVAHNAVPVLNGAGQLVPDADTTAGNAVAFNPLNGQNLEYD